MTREEAINNLNMISVAFVEAETKEQRKIIDDTFNIAIKALDQEPMLDKIRAEIDRIEINGQVDEYTMFIRTGEQVKQMVLDIIDRYKAESEDKE